MNTFSIKGFIWGTILGFIAFLIILFILYVLVEYYTSSFLSFMGPYQLDAQRCLMVGIVVGIYFLSGWISARISKHKKETLTNILSGTFIGTAISLLFIIVWPEMEEAPITMTNILYILLVCNGIPFGTYLCAGIIVFQVRKKKLEFLKKIDPDQMIEEFGKSFSG